MNHTLALTPLQTRALVPSLGDLSAYISAVQKIPMLSPEEELDCARRLRDEDDLRAAERMVMAHLRFVVSVSRKYLGYGLPHADLIQEGNIGLMKAVRRFDPDKGVRLVSYAIFWIKAEIHQYIIKNWRIVKTVTTSAQQKLFFNLRSLRNTLKQEHAEDGYHEALTEAEINEMAQTLDVKTSDVREMERRMTHSHDLVLDTLPDENGDMPFTAIQYVGNSQYEPLAQLEQSEHEHVLSSGISHALEGLDARAKRIVQSRWLEVNEDGRGGATLQDLAQEFGVSVERVRQLEVAALKKMRAVLSKA